MTRTIDLNADIGEATTPSGIATERAILGAVSSANIACGGHAGDAVSMARTVKNAQANGVVIGAHPSYPDRVNFGRRSHIIGVDIAAQDLIDSLFEQIISLVEIAAELGAAVAYIKPHGALYNDAVGSKLHADLLVECVARLDRNLIFMGGPNSEMECAARSAGLRFVREGFIDRRYTDDGHLQSRSLDGAVIKDNAARMAQARNLVSDGSVVTASGQRLNIAAQSLCLHSDSAGALDTATAARRTIESAGLSIAPFADHPFYV